MRKIASILGIILSIVLLVRGMDTLKNGVPSLREKEATHDDGLSTLAVMHDDMATHYVGETLEQASGASVKAAEIQLGTGMAIAGGFGLLLSLYGLGAAYESSRQTQLLQQLAEKKTGQPASAERKAPRPAVELPASQGKGERWLCSNCKHQNPAYSKTCDFCGIPRENA